MSEITKLFDLEVEDMLLFLAIHNPNIATDIQFQPHLFTEERADLASHLPKLWMAKEPINPTTLRVVGCSDLAIDAFDLTCQKHAESPPEAESADSMFASLREMSCLRHIETSTRNRHSESIKNGVSSTQILESLQQDVSEAERILDITSTQTSDGSQVNDLLDLIAKRVENPGHIDGVESDFRILDRMINGFQGGRLYLIGARPHVGKTALSMSLMMGMLKEGTRCGFFSLEMSALQLKELMLQFVSGVNTHAHLDGRFTRDELTRIKSAMEKMQDFKWQIDDRDRIDLQSFKARARHLKRKHGCQIIFVDYIQIMRGQERRGQERRNEVGEISASLKAMSKELDIPIVAMSQITRQEPRFDKIKERTTYPRPRLDGLKESGDLEQDADVVILIHRDVEEKPEPGTEETQCVAILAKNRSTGRLGDIPLLFNHKSASFRENPIG